MTTPKHFSLIVLAGAALALGACGNSGVNDQDRVQSIQQEGAQLQGQGAALQKKVKALNDDVAAGRKTQADADAEIQKDTAALEQGAKGAASDALDAAKDTNGIPDDAKKALEQAQQQVDATP